MLKLTDFLILNPFWWALNAKIEGSLYAFYIVLNKEYLILNSFYHEILYDKVIGYLCMKTNLFKNHTE